jgi:DNA-binding transcriptional LysR family regulator
MNIANIEAFVYVYHLGSFSKAAEALYLTQPSVTARIQSLERELNTKLFHRIGKNVLLTETGKQVLPYAQDILQTYQRVKLNIQQDSKKNELIIGCSLTISNYLLPDLLQSFRKKYPEVSIQVYTGHSQDILDKVLNKEVHFGIARTVSNPKIETHSILVDPLRLVVPKGHPLFGLSRPIPLKTVSREPLIFLERNSIDWLMVHGLFEANQLDPYVALQVDNIEAAKKMVKKGIGISFLPQLCIKEELSSGDLWELSIDPPVQIARKIDLLYLKGSEMPPYLDFFMENINSTLKRRAKTLTV